MAFITSSGTSLSDTTQGRPGMIEPEKAIESGYPVTGIL
jgi:hypothetical protein